MMVGRLLSYWEGNFSGAMLNFGRVVTYSNLGKSKVFKTHGTVTTDARNWGQDVGHCMTSAVSFAQDLLRPKKKIWKNAGWPVFSASCLMMYRKKGAGQGVQYLPSAKTKMTTENHHVSIQHTPSNGCFFFGCHVSFPGCTFPEDNALFSSEIWGW